MKQSHSSEKGFALLALLGALLIAIPSSGLGLSAAIVQSGLVHAAPKPVKKVIQEPKTFSLTIKEWGVAVPLTDTTRDAYYQMDPAGTVSISSWELESLDEQIGACLSGVGPIVLTRTNALTAPTAQTDISTPMPAPIKVGTWYYLEQSPASNCTVKPTAQVQQAQTIRAELDAVVQKLKATK